MDAVLALVASLASLVSPHAGLVRGPVITQPTEDGAVISWTTRSPAAASVVVGQRAYAAGRTDAPSVRVDGLEPGRRYAWSVRAGFRVLARGSLRTSPRPEGAGARFTAAVFGDYGSGDANQRAVVRIARGFDPDLTITTGDNIYPLALDGLLDSRLFKPLRPLLRSSAFVPALGNHDTYFTGGRLLLGALVLPEPERWYVQRYGSAAFIVLDSDVAAGPRSPQGRFLRRALRTTRDACFRIVVFHHPPFSPHSEGIAPRMREQVVPLLEEEGIPLVLLGHVHTYERSQPRNGVTYVVVGTGGAEIGDYGATTIPVATLVSGRYGALRLDVGARDLVGSFVTTDGVERDRFELACG